jgi:NADPH-dependent glutamate synthase beta subunit-like oxidoreductase
MLTAFLAIGGIGLLAGLGLALASKIFYVYVDPKIVAVEEALPGANCGGCGFPGCSGAASAIVRGEAPPNICVGGGTDVHARVGQILGVAVEEREPDFARPGCSYGVDTADLKYIYDGVNDCRAAALLSGGAKECPIGCLGLGTCVRACPFGALSMGPNQLPVVDTTLCTGCGTCERICPKHIITLTSASKRITSEYVTDECTAPCQRTCPTGIDIPGYIREISAGNYEEALRIIKEKCPLPLICGHICPAPCELQCRRNFVDEGVAINWLKRFAAEYEMTTGRHINPYKSPLTGHRIALIGGGAEGLTAAYYLARMGYEPTIFEAKPQLGGILRYVIAENRLPRNVLDHDIHGILEMGVDAKTDMVMGVDFTLASLIKEGFDAVLLTSGGFDSRKILQSGPEGPHSSVPGIFLMLDLLAALTGDHKPDLRGHVVIVDTSPMGVSMARKCREMGAGKVTIVSHMPLHFLPAEFQNLTGLRNDGIEIQPNCRVVRLGGTADRLERIRLNCIDVRTGVESDKDLTDAETLVVSSGRLPELLLVPPTDKGESSPDAGAWQTVETFSTFPGQDGRGLFGSPEPGRISDSSAVVKAILSGRRLARAVHMHFSTGVIDPVEHLACEADHVLDVDSVHSVNLLERQLPGITDIEGPGKTAWIFPKELPGLDESAARKEAERCLQCGLICYRKSA